MQLNIGVICVMLQNLNAVVYEVIPWQLDLLLSSAKEQTLHILDSEAELGTHAKNKQNTFYERKLSAVWMLISRSDVHLMVDNFTDSFPFK